MNCALCHVSPKTFFKYLDILKMALKTEKMALKTEKIALKIEKIALKTEKMEATMGLRKILKLTVHCVMCKT